MKPRVLIMAGGTGGHVFPALSLAAALREHGCETVWLGTRGGIEARLVPAAGHPIEFLDVAGLRGKGLLGWLGAPWRLSQALWAACRIIRQQRPVLVVGLGGYVTGPGGLAAWLCRRPLVIHEQNAIAGFTNRILARFADAVLEAFPGSFSTSVPAQCVGNPVRQEFFEIADPAVRYASHPGPLQVLVVGGSQGAARLNAVVPEAMARLQGQLVLQLRHQCGARGLQTTEARYAELGVPADIVAFIDDMPRAYAEADILICRAGALTVSEVAAAGVPAIFVPFPAAVDDHQTRNALALVHQGAAVMLAESALTAESLAAVILQLGTDRDRRIEMGVKARASAMPHATESLTRVCLQVARLAA
jgi:UDP-N-acetylglucosamine--N-acetylmuramyl-(pentapeptide) pyrophosphoryl-undecaprenol N-acetylglucosamine transferase